MANINVRELIGRTSEAIPGVAIAVAGVSLAIYAFESNRMASFQNVPSASMMNAASLLTTALALTVLALCYRARPALRIHRHPISGFAIAGALSVSLLLASGAIAGLPNQILVLGSLVGGVAKSLLLLCWVEVLTSFKGRQTAVILALAMLATGILNGLSALVKQDAVVMLVATIPLLSIACLYWFKDKQESFDASPRRLLGGEGPRRKDVLKAPSLYSPGLVLVFLVPLACYTFAFGSIHYAWVPFQDGSNGSLTIQLAAALGTALAALFLLLLISFFWGPKKLEMYSLFILFLLGIALYVTAMFGGMAPGLYIVPLNIAQKLTLFLVLMTPFLVPAKRSSLGVAATASALYTLGRALTTFAAGLLEPSVYSIAVAVVIVAAALSVLAGLMANSSVGTEANGDGQKTDDDQAAGSKSVRLRKAAISPAESELQPHQGLKEDAGGDDSRLMATCEAIGRAHGLTNREREILWLLAQGMTAGAIAEELTVSTSTVKTHMRNVYAKLDIHTQNELLIMVHRG